MERGRIDLPDRQPHRMVRRQPLPHIRWHQEPLIPINRSITLGHQHILPKTPGQSTCAAPAGSILQQPDRPAEWSATRHRDRRGPATPMIRLADPVSGADARPTAHRPAAIGPRDARPRIGRPVPDAKPAFGDLHGAGEGDRRPTLPVPPTAAPACGVTGGSSESPTFPCCRGLPRGPAQPGALGQATGRTRTASAGVTPVLDTESNCGTTLSETTLGENRVPPATANGSSAAGVLLPAQWRGPGSDLVSVRIVAPFVVCGRRRSLTCWNASP